MMKDTLIIEKVQKNNNKITIIFSYTGEWNNYLRENKFKNTYDEKIEKVPDSIAVIPFLCNILPIAWVYDFKIEIPEIDETFYKSIPKILDGYKKMYPDFNFGGEIVSGKIISNTYKTNRNGIMFSGGVDATTTTYRHLDVLSDAITVLGSDIDLTDKAGIENVNLLNSTFSKKHGLMYEKIYSTFRVFLDEGALQNTEKMSGHGWWHDFQHGIGLLGLVAPLAYIRGYKTVYIASSYHKNQRGEYVCASDPLIDNQVKYGSTDVYHDGYELTRQDKIEYICKYAKEHNLKPYLRVCWISNGGENCCHCEKCRRTYLGILAAKYNPKDFGLDFSDIQYKRMIAWCKKHFKYNFSHDTIPYYQSIQDGFLRNYSEEQVPDELKWILTVKIGGKKAPWYLHYIDTARKLLGIE